MTREEVLKVASLVREVCFEEWRLIEGIEYFCHKGEETKIDEVNLEEIVDTFCLINGVKLDG